MIKCKIIIYKKKYNIENEIEHYYNNPKIEIIDIKFNASATTSGGTYTCLIIYE